MTALLIFTIGYAAGFAAAVLLWLFFGEPSPAKPGRK